MQWTSFLKSQVVKMQKYNKLWAVIIGVSALIALRHFEVEVPGLGSFVLELAMGAATAFGVYQVPNQK